jgi:hypothetical protein
VDLSVQVRPLSLPPFLFRSDNTLFLPHLSNMQIAVEPKVDLQTLEDLRDARAQSCQRVLDVCYRFRKWERDAMLLGDPSPETINWHRETLSAMIKEIDLITAFSAHPDSYEHPFHRKFVALDGQLRISWNMFHNPLPKEESERLDKIFAEKFPE